MNVEIKEIGANRKEMEILVPVEEVRKAADAIYRDISKNVNIKGFRKGKAPRNVIKGYYGEYISAELSKKLINDSFEQAVADNDVFPVSMPEFDNEDPAEDKEFKFVARFDVKPEVEAQKYTGFAIKKPKGTVNEKAIDGVIDHLRANYADVTEVEDKDYAAQEGDYVVVNLASEAKPELKRENMTVEAGGMSVIPGVETAIVAMKAGEEKEIEVDFPEDHFMEDLRGEKVSVKISVTAIKNKTLPEVDDEFAKKVRPTVETVADLRKAIEDDLKERSEQEIKSALEKQVADNLLKENPFEVPESMVQMQANMMMQSMAQRFASQGMNISDIFPDFDGMREETLKSAESVVKMALLVESIAKAEKIEAEDADIDKQIQEIADKYQMDVDTVRSGMEERGGIEELKFKIIEEKVFDYIVKNSEVEEVEKLDLDQEEESDDASAGSGGADE